LGDKNIKPINIFRMADLTRKGLVSSKQLITSLHKILPQIDNSVYAEACKAFGIKGQTGKISENDFLLVFEPT
jgi:hypothetical protein